LVYELEDVVSVAFFLNLATGDFGFDEAGDAVGEVGDFACFGEEFLGNRDAVHGREVSMVVGKIKRFHGARGPLRGRS